MLLTWELMWSTQHAQDSYSPTVCFLKHYPALVSGRRYFWHTHDFGDQLFFSHWQSYATQNCSSSTARLDTNLCLNHQSKRRRTVRKYLVLKHVNVTTQREEATTTPMVHLGKKHHVQRWRLDKIALLRKLILHSAESTSSLLIHVKTVTRFLPNEVEIN